MKSFLHAVMLLAARLEVRDLAPPRFSSEGRERWRSFRGLAAEEDLAELALRDLAARFPLPFDPAQWGVDAGWPAIANIPDRERAALVREAGEAVNSGLPAERLFERAARLLGTEWMPLPYVPPVATHELVLEMPGSCGAISYALSGREFSTIVFDNNCWVLCGSPEERVLASMVAVEANAQGREVPSRVVIGPDTFREQGLRFHRAFGYRRYRNQAPDLAGLLREGAQVEWLDV